MNNFSWGYPQNDYRGYLEHHGIPGMRWGVRRFQNKDGSLTSKGKKRYSTVVSDKELSEYRKRKIAEAPSKTQSPRGANKGWYKNAPKSVLKRQYLAEQRKSENKLNSVGDVIKQKLSDPKTKKAIKAGAIALGTAAALYGGYKLSKHISNKIDLKNLEFASTAGNVFGNRFVDTTHPMQLGPRPIDHNRYVNAVRIGDMLRAPLSAKASENIYDSRGGKLGSLKRLKQYNDVLKGKKTIDDIFNYKDVMDKVIDDSGWDKGSTDRLAVFLRDYNNLGGGQVSAFRRKR